jgi:transcriptional regulator of met regulon
MEKDTKMEDFTRDEIENLLEALDSWVQSLTSNSLLIAMLGMGLSKDEESAKKRMDDFANDTDKRQQEVKTRSEQAILLKAKLLKMRDAVEAQEFVGSIIK